MTSKFRGRQKSWRFQILDHHSLPFKWPPNLEAKTPEKLQISNFGSPLPTLQMTSKFRDQKRQKSCRFAKTQISFPLSSSARPSGRAVLLAEEWWLPHHLPNNSPSPTIPYSYTLNILSLTSINLYFPPTHYLYLTPFPPTPKPSIHHLSRSARPSGRAILLVPD